MKIRSITYFCNPKYPLDEKILQKAGQFLTESKFAYEAAGYEVQTTRLATIPFPELLGNENIGKLPAFASQIDQIAQGLKIEYLSLGPALPEIPSSYAVIPEAVFVSKVIFFGGVMADKQRGIDLSAVRACADVIVKCASIEPNGFANLQFAALANVEAGTPFLPAAYHNSDEPAFAVATESADLAVQAFESAKHIEEARRNLISVIEQHGKRLTEVAKSLRCKFGGIDFSLAPFPTETQSLGTAFERLGVQKIGLHGSLLAAAILTEAIDRANFLHAGFSGLMMPVLEDSTLARRAAEGTLTIKDVLLYSAVCGTGLDTIPLPGDTTAEQITPLLLDLCALALRLDKPLTARLMPIPNKKAGDETDFDFAFFAPSRVMALDSAGLTGALSGTETFQLTPRKQ
jgi:uncharacterized protein